MGASAIVRFYRGEERDHRGRHLDEIVAWDDGRLEEVHDFIQWLFPLDEPSGVNPFAPVLTTDDRRAFATDRALATNLRRAFLRLTAFYGFELVEAPGLALRHAANWPDRARVWLRPYSHNFLRLTRIIKSMRLLGLPEYGHALYDALAREYRAEPATIGSTTMTYWRAAAEPLRRE